MKRCLPLMLALILAFVLFMPVQAAGNRRSPFALVGTITSLNPTTQSITVQVLRGNTLVKPYLGQVVTLVTMPSTQFRFTDGIKTVIIKFGDLKVGNTISASGTLSSGIWTATRITVGARLDCLK